MKNVSKMSQSIGDLLLFNARYPLNVRIAATLVKREYTLDDVLEWYRNPSFYLNPKRKTRLTGYIPEPDRALIMQYFDSLKKSGRCVLTLTNDTYGFPHQVFLEEIPEVDIPFKESV